jgi:hypothetical protein
LLERLDEGKQRVAGTNVKSAAESAAGAAFTRDDDAPLIDFDEVRAERMALWELANVRESLDEPASAQTAPRRLLEPADRSRTPRPRSQLRSPAVPILGHEHRPPFQRFPIESPI